MDNGDGEAPDFAMLLAMETFATARPPRHASSFDDQDAAETFMGVLINAHAPEVIDWLATGRPWLVVEDDFDAPTGRSASIAGVEEVTGVRVVLARDEEMPDGFRVHTGYPQRAREPRTDLPALRHLTGVYFHQDWDRDFGTYPVALAAFLRDSPDLATPLVEELERIGTLSEDQLDALLDQLGCQFTLDRGETWQGWVDDVARRLREAIAQGAR